MSNSDLEIFHPQGKSIKVAGEIFEIKPFVVKNRIKAVRVFAGVFTELGTRVKEDPSFNLNNVVSVATALIDTAGEKLTDIYEVALGKDREWIENNVIIKDEIEILIAIFEVNEFPLVLSQISNLISKAKQAKATTEI